MAKKQSDKTVKNTFGNTPRHIPHGFAIGPEDAEVIRQRPGLNFFVTGEAAKTGQVVFLDPKTLKLYLASSAERVIDAGREPTPQVADHRSKSACVYHRAEANPQRPSDPQPFKPGV